MEEQGTPAGSLQDALLIQERVLRRGPRDWVVQFAWALWVLVFIPPFDVVRSDIWGPVVLISSAVGSVITFRYYAARYNRVHPLGPTRRGAWVVWVVWGLWYGGWIVFAELLTGRLAVAWTVAAVAAASPLLVYALLARHRAQVR